MTNEQYQKLLNEMYEQLLSHRLGGSPPKKKTYDDWVGEYAAECARRDAEERARKAKMNYDNYPRQGYTHDEDVFDDFKRRFPGFGVKPPQTPQKAAPAPINTPLGVLGLNTDAEWPEIQEAYRRLARNFHPDVCQDANAHENMAKINQAYRTLRKKLGK